MKILEMNDNEDEDKKNFIDTAGAAHLFLSTMYWALCWVL